MVDRTVPDQSQTGNASGPGGASKQDGVPPANAAAIYTRNDALVALGLEKDTVPSLPKIKEAFKVIAAKNHPDKLPLDMDDMEKSDCIKRFTAASNAVEFLTGKEKPRLEK